MTTQNNAVEVPETKTPVKKTSTKKRTTAVKKTSTTKKTATAKKTPTAAAKKAAPKKAAPKKAAPKKTTTKKTASKTETPPKKVEKVEKVAAVKTATGKLSKKVLTNVENGGTVKWTEAKKRAILCLRKLEATSSKTAVTAEAAAKMDDMINASTIKHRFDPRWDLGAFVDIHVLEGGTAYSLTKQGMDVKFGD